MTMTLKTASELRSPRPPFSNSMDPCQFFSGKYPEHGFIEFFLEDGQPGTLWSGRGFEKEGSQSPAAHSRVSVHHRFVSSIKSWYEGVRVRPRPLSG